jgi:hypothetical protein
MKQTHRILRWIVLLFAIGALGAVTPIADLTHLSATNLTSGTIPDARFPATLPAASGANLTALNGSNISSGTVAIARGGTGAATANANQVFGGPTSGGAAAPSFRALVAGDIPSLPASQITTGQLAIARGGTGADLSATGGSTSFLRQASTGAAVTVGAMTSADLPTLVFPTRAEWFAINHKIVTGNAMAWDESNPPGGIPFKGVWYQNAPANGDESTYRCFLAAGTYKIEIFGWSFSNAAKTDIYADGTKIGTVDWYSAGSSRNYNGLAGTSLTFTLAAPKNILIRYVTNGHTAPSGDWYSPMTYTRVLPTTAD